MIKFIYPSGQCPFNYDLMKREKVYKKRKEGNNGS